VTHAWKLQNHKTVEAGRDLLRSFCPTSLLKESQLEEVAQVHAQMAFKYFQRSWRKKKHENSLMLCFSFLQQVRGAFSGARAGNTGKHQNTTALLKGSFIAVQFRK